MVEIKKNSGFIYLKNCSKIIRYRNYNIIHDENNFYREQLMLFTSWRNENDVTDDDTSKLENLFRCKIDEITNNRRKYIYTDTIEIEIEDALQDIQNDMNDEFIDDINKQKDNIVDGLAIYEIDEPATDIGLEMPNNFDTIDVVQNIALPRQISNDEYYALIRQLNDTQYRYHHNFTYLLRNKSNERKIYDFIAGSAGVGKSILIEAITQTTLRYYNSIPGNNPNDISILLCAYTGQAAFNIKGITLHSTFYLPVNNESMNPLSLDVLNNLSTKLCHLKFLIIDEISMVGRRVFTQINKRLQEIFHSKELFGRVSIIAFGDFNQLQPVMDG